MRPWVLLVLLAVPAPPAGAQPLAQLAAGLEQVHAPSSKWVDHGGTCETVCDAGDCYLQCTWRPQQVYDQASFSSSMDDSALRTHAHEASLLDRDERYYVGMKTEEVSAGATTWMGPIAVYNPTVIGSKYGEQRMVTEVVVLTIAVVPRRSVWAKRLGLDPDSRAKTQAAEAAATAPPPAMDGNDDTLVTVAGVAAVGVVAALVGVVVYVFITPARDVAVDVAFPSPRP